MNRLAAPLVLLACCAGCGSATKRSSLSSEISTRESLTSAVIAGSGRPSPDMIFAPTTASTSTVPVDTSWLEPFATEPPLPAVPEGWHVLDLGLVRFAVPSDWQVPMSQECLAGPAPGVVLLPLLTAGATCSPSPVMPDDKLTIGRADGATPSTPPDSKVGDLQAWQVSGAATATFRLAGGIDVCAVGPDAAAVLATFTTSG